MIKCKTSCTKGLNFCCADCEHNKYDKCNLSNHSTCAESRRLKKESIPILCKESIWINEEEKENE